MTMTPEYGICPCTGRYDNRTVEVSMTVNDKPVVLDNVPQGACPLCGSRVYKTYVLESIKTVFKSSNRLTSQQ